MRARERDRVGRIALSVAVAVVLVVILWIDIATGVWQEFVILAGVAAGLVTFVLTVLVLDRIVARSTAQRWAPVTLLALTEFLHALADNERSEITRGIVHPRWLPDPPAVDTPSLEADLHALRSLVVDERERLANVLGTWSNFLASSSEHEDLLIQIANIAMKLDRVRDESMEFEAKPSTERRTALAREIDTFNERVRVLVNTIEERLERHEIA